MTNFLEYSVKFIMGLIICSKNKLELSLSMNDLNVML